MREILFRGKCFNTEEWVEGYLGIEVPDELVIQQFSFDDYFNSDCIDQHRVKPETVGQYTGLTDKNGLTKVFEGDVVKANDTYTGMSFIGVVKFDNGLFYIGDSDSNSHYRWRNYEVEVIGNVFDNSLEELQNGN